MARLPTSPTFIGANTPPDNPSLRAESAAVKPVSQPRYQQSAAAKDREAVDPAHGWIVRLMQREGKGILHLLWRLLGQEADVMDAYQDCFCKLATRRGGGPLVHARAYLYRTATNIAIEMIRTRNRRNAHHPAVAADKATRSFRERDESTFRDDESAHAVGLHPALAQLPPHLYQVIVLRDFCRMPYEAVGRTLEIDPATARVYRRHAVVRLAQLMHEKEKTR